MRVLGMISGTSHDAIDTALVDIRHRGGRLHCRVLGTGATPYPADLRRELVEALPPGRVGLDAVCRLDTRIGRAFAEAARRTVAEHGPADLVCSHGQTLYHWVQGGEVLGTLQVGQPAWTAELLGVPVVSDLRARDVAAGGQGAPLVAHLDTLLLAGLPGRAAALNLGGIANITVAGDPPLAYDTGPANALVDAAVLAATGAPYDDGGRIAAAGSVQPGLLAELLDEPYYRLPPPKTTGKELFHPGLLGALRTRHPGLALSDLVATLTALTARTVAAEVERHGVTTLVASGGGMRNPVLTGMLRELLPDVRLLQSEELGLPADAKEAIAFAVLGWYTVHGLPATLPSCTGARGARILGSLTPGEAPLRLPAPLAAAPTAISFVS
ncbi:anhydro-N-acetylmuramic acid kinase [Peterkaempfera griseoplana]|uniref:anhydro-N-acetylmuramic acid kinase n=1 Tax=Peterkaempfera griseoplana TaxID=66896 RepID=UPI0006E19B46|nr:anhydro-N-acetylmuramic acid kinase [Peterkaempfera griseoplana]